MRRFSFFLLAGAALPALSAHAMEAVAQQPYWQNAGKNLTASMKVDAVGTRVVHLSETLTQFIVCNKAGQLWDGTNCVAPVAGGIPACGPNQFVQGNGTKLACKDLPAVPPVVSPSSSLPLPTCTEGQVVTVKDGELTCVTPGARKTVTNLGGSSIAWSGVKSSRTVTQTIAIPEDANVLVVESRCSVLANNGSVFTFLSFTPSQAPVYTACYQNGNNSNQTASTGDSKSYSIPKGATTLALTNWTSGISSPEVASSVVNYTFLKEE